jgi:hypothetical protein
VEHAWVVIFDPRLLDILDSNLEGVDLRRQGVYLGVKLGTQGVDLGTQGVELGIEGVELGIEGGDAISDLFKLVRWMGKIWDMFDLSDNLSQSISE